MIPYVRQQKILEELEKSEMLYIEDLSTMFPDFSESTIRRDLKTLEDDNVVTLLRGGAVKLKVSSYEAPADEKMHLYTEEKETIARIAASLVKNNEVIYIDSGTTTLGIVKHITAHNVKVVTTNTHLLLEPMKPNIDSVITLTGEVSYKLASISGTLTDLALNNMYFDKAFVGATGFGIEVGINTPDIREASKKQIVRKNSKSTYVLADMSKYNRRAFHKSFDLRDCTLITDQRIDEFDRNGVAYLYM